jgi:RNA-binding protein YlmH
MGEKESILKRVSGPDDRLLISKALDKAELAGKTGRPAYTDFMDPRQQMVLNKAFEGYDYLNCSFYGGYAQAERALAIFLPDYMEDGDYIKECADFLKILHIIPSSRDKLSHRDYLGALLALGIKREKTGDILVRDEYADIFVLSEIAGFIQANLEKVGNCRVSVSFNDIEQLSAPEQKVKEINVTVASLRLDCIAGPGFGMSRSKAAEFIKAGRLNLNWEVTDNPSKMLKEGDTISIRGKGKIVLESIGNKTRKDRIGILIKKFI